MKLAQRILVGLMGLGSLLITTQLWFAQDTALSPFGITTLNQVGRQTVRADMAGLFCSIGVFALIAAWKTSRTWALGALVLASCAILGRFIGVLTDGAGPGVWGPIGVEAVSIAILLWVRQAWKTAG